ncbi:hypothetical protein KY366_02520 [Candidatus Woesearchaeota archaeon]|nr:hypothetical protein [Candidatus Woesearchaeota archaeon]
MCFSPHVSIITSLVEFAIGTIILLRFRRSIVSRFTALFIFILGFYQLTEFMLCTSDNFVLWGSLGFIAYTLLPAVGLHFALRLIHSKRKPLPLYVPALIFAMLPLSQERFVTGGTCHAVFITVRNILLNPGNVLFFIYFLYYFGYISIACCLIWNRCKKERNRMRRRLYLIGISAVLISTLPALLFIAIFPAYRIMFPSIYCEFALVFAITGYIAASLDDKYSLS